MTEASFNLLPPTNPPEMQRTDLTSCALTLLALGVRDVAHFDFLSPPSSDALILALEVLYSLGALTEEGELTAVGRQMADMPIEVNQ